jgi:hypothetical protein
MPGRLGGRRSMDRLYHSGNLDLQPPVTAAEHETPAQDRLYVSQVVSPVGMGYLVSLVDITGGEREREPPCAHGFAERLKQGARVRMLLGMFCSTSQFDPLVLIEIGD